MTNTTTSFSAMLNEFLPNDLLKEELIKRSWILNNVERDDTWLGGDLVVPFKAAGASSIKMGSLTAADDIAEDNYQRGKVEDYQEIWGSMIFNEADLQQHGKISEQNFLKILPDTVDEFMEYMKEVASSQMHNASYFATVTDATNAATGVLVVDYPERFVIGQKVTLDDGDSNQASFYVTAINLNTKEVTIATARGGSTYTGVSDYSVDQSARFYYDGVLVAGTVTNKFTSLRDALLSNANGGSANLYGKSKVAYPYLQAINVDGSDITAVNILEKLFDAYSTVRQRARGKANKIVMSLKNFGSCMKAVELQKGAYKTLPNTMKATEFGWSEIQIMSVTGELLTLVGVQEMDNDVIFFLDLTSMKFYSNGFFKKRVDPDDGKEFYTVRNTTGYQYIVDICCFGDLVVHRPGVNGILYSISY